tara:strand:+ start:76 stop:666 length:591 start_codon:yes stop_codon:yes gene_type:complete
MDYEQVFAAQPDYGDGGGFNSGGMNAQLSNSSIYDNGSDFGVGAFPGGAPFYPMGAPSDAKVTPTPTPAPINNPVADTPRPSPVFSTGPSGSNLGGFIPSYADLRTPPVGVFSSDTPPVAPAYTPPVAPAYTPPVAPAYTPPVAPPVSPTPIGIVPTPTIPQTRPPVVRAPKLKAPVQNYMPTANANSGWTSGGWE